MQVFYNTQKLSLKQKDQICYEAKERSYTWWVDKKDSWRREKIEMDFDEIMAKLSPTCHFVIIQRDVSGEGIYLEVGFCTMRETPEYFLWIYCKIENLEFFIDKYKLMPCQ